MDPLLPSRWQESPPIPTSTSASFANQAPPVNVQIHLAPTFTNKITPASTMAVITGFMLGVAAVLLLSGDPRERPK